MEILVIGGIVLLTWLVLKPGQVQGMASTQASMQPQSMMARTSNVVMMPSRAAIMPVNDTPAIIALNTSNAPNPVFIQAPSQTPMPSALSVAAIMPPNLVSLPAPSSPAMLPPVYTPMYGPPVPVSRNFSQLPGDSLGNDASLSLGSIY